MSTARKHLGCAVYNDYIYAVGGRDDCTELNSVERYCDKDDRWTPVVAMQMKRSGVGLAVVGGQLLGILYRIVWYSWTWQGNIQNLQINTVSDAHSGITRLSFLLSCWRLWRVKLSQIGGNIGQRKWFLEDVCWEGQHALQTAWWRCRCREAPESV